MRSATQLLLLVAIAFGTAAQAKQGASAPASPIVVSKTINAGDYAEVEVIFSGATPGQVTSITGGGAWVLRGRVVNGTVAVEKWSTGAGQASAAVSISIAFSGTNDGVQAELGTWTGVLGLGSAVTATGTAANPSIALTTQDANNVVTAGFGWADATAALAVPTTGTGNFRTGDTNSVAGVNDSAAALTDNTSASPGSVTNSVTEAVSAGTKWAAIALELRSVAPTPPLLGNLFVGPVGFGR